MTPAESLTRSSAPRGLHTDATRVAEAGSSFRLIHVPIRPSLGAPACPRQIFPVRRFAVVGKINCLTGSERPFR